MSATTLFILHGWAIDPHNQKKWQFLIQQLKKISLNVKFLETPGLSQKLDQVWQLNDFVAWLKKETEAEKEFILLGHSFGGQIAARFTALYPAKVKKLILIDSAGIRDHSFFIEAKRLIFYLLAKTGKTLISWLAFIKLAALQELLRKILYQLAREKDYYQAPPLLRKTMTQVIQEEISADLEKINCPTLIIWGENDQSTPLKLGRQMQVKIKNSQLKIVAGARHAPQFTHPDQVIQLIKEFTH